VAHFRLSPAAEADLEDIFDYTVRLWGLEQAERYIGMIEEACASLAGSPDLGQDCSHVRAGYRRGVVEGHVVYFRPEDYGIAVIRILHARMDASRYL
jgi:toxin ParE1/3/4